MDAPRRRPRASRPAPRGGDRRPAATVADLLDADAEVYAALVLGTRDYVRKNGFEHVVFGLSGGVDSTLVAPSPSTRWARRRSPRWSCRRRFSSSGTQGDARLLAANLGIECLEFAIGDLMDTYDATLAPVFGDRGRDITEENLQARIRGNLLMALSNKFGWLVLTTGNKSEMSVGYSTLYGDSAGGFAVIKDCPKLLVYRLVDVRARRDPTPPSRSRSWSARRRPSCAPTRATRTRCRPTRCSTRSSRATSAGPRARGPCSTTRSWTAACSAPARSIGKACLCSRTSGARALGRGYLEMTGYASRLVL